MPASRAVTRAFGNSCRVTIPMPTSKTTRRASGISVSETQASMTLKRIVAQTKAPMLNQEDPSCDGVGASRGGEREQSVPVRCLRGAASCVPVGCGSTGKGTYRDGAVVERFFSNLVILLVACSFFYWQTYSLTVSLARFGAHMIVNLASTRAVYSCS
jgi:hypothetical protein